MDAVTVAVARARRFVGVRFRPQGREPATGLDCIGMVAAAYGVRGVRRDYRMRGGGPQAVEAGLAEHGFARVTAERAGDVLVVRAGPGQPHVVIWTGDGYLHADAGLARVVEVPGAVPWPVASMWRYVDLG